MITYIQKIIDQNFVIKKSIPKVVVAVILFSLDLSVTKSHQKCSVISPITRMLCSGANLFTFLREGKWRPTLLTHTHKHLMQPSSLIFFTALFFFLSEVPCTHFSNSFPNEWKKPVEERGISLILKAWNRKLLNSFFLFIVDFNVYTSAIGIFSEE